MRIPKQRQRSEHFDKIALLLEHCWVYPGTRNLDIEIPGYLTGTIQFVCKENLCFTNHSKSLLFNQHTCTKFGNLNSFTVEIDYSRIVLNPQEVTLVKFQWTFPEMVLYKDLKITSSPKLGILKFDHLKTKIS